MAKDPNTVPGGSQGEPQGLRARERDEETRLGESVGISLALMSNNDRLCGYAQACARESILSWQKCRC
jgi:hypothetical protein